MDGASADGVLGETPPLASGGVDRNSLGAPAGQSPPGQCTSDCVPPSLSLDLDAGAPAVEAPSSDAGAAPSADDGGLSRCAPGATLGPDQRCFALQNTPSSWQDARELCQGRGAGWDLATIRSAQRNTFITGLLGTVTDAWVGATDSQNEGVWTWVGDSTAFWNGNGTTGSAVGNAFVNWTAGTNPEPNGADLSDCLRLRAGGGWADLQCATQFAALCEGPTL